MSTKSHPTGSKAGQRSTEAAGRQSAAATGKVARLSDPGMHDRLTALKASLADPAKARAFLQDVGTLTPGGKLSRRYGGR